MTPRRAVLLTAAWLVGVGAALLAQVPQRPVPSPQTFSVGQHSDLQALRATDALIDRMLRNQQLKRRVQITDTLLPGRLHERLDEYYQGVRVWGGDVARQLVAGQTTSILGTVHSDLNVDVSAGLTPREATARAEAAIEDGLAYPLEAPELVVLPTADEAVLCYLVKVHTRSDCLTVFVNADTGEIELQFSNLKIQQAVVGTATGVLGDRKKISASSYDGRYVADDQLRPPDRFRTFDLKGDVNTTLDVLYEGRSLYYDTDLAQDADNTWEDGAVVDAHVYAGFTYDYFFKRFGRKGLDDNDSRVLSIVHPIRRSDFWTWYNTPDWPVVGRFFANAFYDSHWGGLIVYGEGLPTDVTPGGRTADFQSSALDTVAHELTHGVTDFSSQLIYRDESGALNEAFSDIMATGVEWFFQPPGTSASLRTADYLISEDSNRPGGIRSIADPQAHGDPDHYGLRYTGPDDNGGVHWNSTIASHAYYLAVEGGKDRASQLTVQGVGRSNRDQIEKVFYRAFVYMLPSTATFVWARWATLQAAADLYGANSGVERAVRQAWAAVGVSSLAIDFTRAVLASPGLCQQTSPSWVIDIEVSEKMGHGFTVTDWLGRFYDSRGNVTGTSAHAASVFADWFDQCGQGSTYLAPGSRACTRLCVSLGGRTSGYYQVELDGVTGSGQEETVTSVLVPLGTSSFPTGTALAAGAAAGAPADAVVRR